MIFKKLFFNSYLAFKNINRYGIIIILKSSLYELFYSIIYKDFSFFKYDKADNEKVSYTDSKILNDYTAPNIPTPYYFLHLIKTKFCKENITSFNFFDLGCGSGRLVKYLDKNFDINFIGIDNSKYIIDTNTTKFNKSNYKFYLLDLKKIRNILDLNIIENSFLNKKKNVIFISDSVDALTIANFLPIFKEKLGDYIFVMVNQKELGLFDKFNCFGKIFFKDKSRNISFYKI